MNQYAGASEEELKNEGVPMPVEQSPEDVTVPPVPQTPNVPSEDGAETVSDESSAYSNTETRGDETVSSGSDE